MRYPTNKRLEKIHDKAASTSINGTATVARCPSNNTGRITASSNAFD